VTAGNGDDDLSNFTGTVFGNVDLTLGGGANTFLFNGAAFGDRLRYTGGAGVDTVEINGSNNFALTVYLGAGSDVMTISQTDGARTALIDFGVDLSPDTWNPPPTIPFAFRLLRLP
jgi:hypothetical protein